MNIVFFIVESSLYLLVDIYVESILHFLQSPHLKSKWNNQMFCKYRRTTFIVICLCRIEVELHILEEKNPIVKGNLLIQRFIELMTIIMSLYL